MMEWNVDQMGCFIFFRSYKDALSHYRKAADMVSWESARDEAEDYVRMALWAKIMRGVCR